MRPWLSLMLVVSSFAAAASTSLEFNRASPRPIPNLADREHIDIDDLEQAYGPLPPEAFALIALFVDDTNTTKRTWIHGTGINRTEVTETLFEGEPFRYELSGRFKRDPLAGIEDSDVMFLSFSCDGTEPPACTIDVSDRKQLDPLLQTIRERSTTEEVSTIRKAQNADGAIVTWSVEGGVIAGCQHCLAFVLKDHSVVRIDFEEETGRIYTCCAGYSNPSAAALLESLWKQRLTLTERPVETLILLTTEPVAPAAPNELSVTHPLRSVPDFPLDAVIGPMDVLAAYGPLPSALHKRLEADDPTIEISERSWERDQADDRMIVEERLADGEPILFHFLRVPSIDPLAEAGSLDITSLRYRCSDDNQRCDVNTQLPADIDLVLLTIRTQTQSALSRVVRPPATESGPPERWLDRLEVWDGCRDCLVLERESGEPLVLDIDDQGHLFYRGAMFINLDLSEVLDAMMADHAVPRAAK